MVCALFPLAISPDDDQLRVIAPGVIWVGALLATLLSLDMLFRHDFDEGTLEQLLFSKQSLYLLVLIRVLSYWLFTGLPLVLISPLLAIMLFLPVEAYWTLVLSLLIGTPVLCLIGCFAAALTVSIKKGGLVIALLTLPLFMPVLIFGSSAVVASAQGLPANGQLAMLLAFLVFALLFAPLAAAAAIRISVADD